MLGMILCGGYGKRFYPMTAKVPKVLVEIKDAYAVLDRQLFAYKSAGFDRVFLLAGHLGERIRRKYGSSYKGLELTYVFEEEPLGTLNAIRLGMEEADEDSTVSNGDTVTDLNLKRMGEVFERLGSEALVYVVRMRSPYGIVRLKGRLVSSFEEKPLLDHYINGGFYCLSKRVLTLLEKFKTGDIEKTAFPELAAQGKLAYYREEGDPFWAAIDTMKDLEEVRKEYSNRTDKPWGHEKLLELTEKRMEKLLYIIAGYRTSLHYHEIRDETLHVVRGKGWVEFEEGERKRFEKGTKIRIRPKVVHSLVATKNTLLHEVSTPYPEDVVRVRDFYEVR